MKQSYDLELAIQAARKAGKIVSHGFENIQEMREKQEGKGMVTDVDLRSEKAIIKVLQKESPYPILGEETGQVKHKDQGKTTKRWVIDPIDGTTNFMRGIPLFAVSIALMDGDTFQAGVVYHPITQECYFAERGQGAYLNEEQIKVSNNQDPVKAIVYLDWGYGSKWSQAASQMHERLNKHFFIRTLGVTALEFCWVAKGSADIGVTIGDELWDFAAGAVIVQEAGGLVTDFKGQVIKADGRYIVVSNGLVHDKIVQQLNNQDERDTK